MADIQVGKMAARECPFCGFGPVIADAGNFETDQGTKWGRFSCGRCAAKGPEVRTRYLQWNTRRKILAPCHLPRRMTTWGQEAIKEWNSRAEEQSSAK